MQVIETQLEDAFIIKPQIFGDSRGWFMEQYSKKSMLDAGIEIDFVQDNRSFSALKGTLRGLHCQTNPCAQAKLLTVLSGAITDIIVDIRENSPTFMQWIAVELNDENKHSLLVPKGFLHGFITRVDNTQVYYKVDSLYSPECDRSIRFDDKALGIDWNAENPILSDKDLNAPLLCDSDVKFVYGEF